MFNQRNLSQNTKKTIAKPWESINQLNLQFRENLSMVKLLEMGYEVIYIQRAFKVYEQNYGYDYKQDVLCEIVSRLQIKDESNIISTKTVESVYNKNNMLSVPVTVKHDSSVGKYSKFSMTEEWLINDNAKFDCKFNVNIIYSHNETIKTITDAITYYLERKYPPLHLKITSVDIKRSFIKRQLSVNNGFCNNQKLLNESITKYNKSNVTKQGLHIEVKVVYKHEPFPAHITCKQMELKQSGDYKDNNNPPSRDRSSRLSQNLASMFRDDRSQVDDVKEEREPSRRNTGVKDSRVKPRASLESALGRIRSDKWSGNNTNVFAFEFNDSEEKNHDLYEVTKEDKQKYNYTDNAGFYYALIEEFVNNGYEHELGNKFDGKYTIRYKVDEKMQSHRHKVMGSPLNRAEMLALILYTGDGANYDMCKSHRNGDYNKWKWFDYCLWYAIYGLSQVEYGSYSVYTGLEKVKLSKNSIEMGFFTTYVSTSWDRNIARGFIKNEDDGGMIIEIDESFKDNEFVSCCDVSWISKYPQEKEVLFSRSLDWTGDGFKCVVVDEIENIQNVLLSQNCKQKAISISSIV